MRACLKCETSTTNPKFCSRSCAAAYNNSLAPKRKAATGVCADCGGTTSGRRRVRCRLCSDEKRRTAENRTIADIQGAARYQVSAYIRSHARSVLIRIGRPKECASCGYNIHVEVSHRRPIADFPDTARLDEVNHPDNLDYLCRNHHWEFEKGLLVVPKHPTQESNPSIRGRSSKSASSG